MKSESTGELKTSSFAHSDVRVCLVASIECSHIFRIHCHRPNVQSNMLSSSSLHLAIKRLKKQLGSGAPSYISFEVSSSEQESSSLFPSWNKMDLTIKSESAWSTSLNVDVTASARACSLDGVPDTWAASASLRQAMNESTRLVYTFTLGMMASRIFAIW